ncbi:MAG: biotin/lipoyl-binding protein [Bryobacteraceae bacterium]|nr:biotin/lipoyl-binding protein [Bryobacteraceae bacterium]
MKLKITIDNKTYEVDVEAFEPEPPRPQLPPSYMIQPGAARVPAAPAPAAPPTGGEAVDEDKVCRSPINGIVVKVLAQPGQQIQPGDTLLVLEAMKMETNITAPIAGKVAKVNVNAGDSVQSGAVLVEFE